MKINRIIIENYLCYYEKKTFNLSDGLNIIIGENGEGKTKFYEALDWMFTGLIDGKEPKLLELISAKKKKDSSVGGKFEVSVSIEVRQFNEVKYVKRSYVVTKESDLNFITSQVMLTATVDKVNGEREHARAEQIFSEIFPERYRRFSMFKGEQEFRILEKPDSFNELVAAFSESSDYENYTKAISEMRKIREKSISEAGKRSQKDSINYQIAKTKIEEKEKEVKSFSDRLYIIKNNKNILEQQIKLHESSVANSEEIEKLNKRIAELEQAIKSKQDLIDQDYTKYLFDEKWILRDFESVFNEYCRKIEHFSKEKWEQESNYQKKIAYEQGQADLITAHKANLPFDVPSVDLMRDMLEEEICKVCNRSAPIGSDAYIFMKSRFEKYKKIVEGGAKKKKEQFLFSNDYLGKLRFIMDTHRNNRLLAEDIMESIEQKKQSNHSLFEEINDLNNKLASEKKEKSRIISFSNESEERSQNKLTDYRSWIQDLWDCKREEITFTEKLNDLVNELKDLEEEATRYNKTKDPILGKARDLYDTISKIFNDTKERKFDDFIEKLQRETNEIFGKINLDAFKGYIKFEKKLIGTKANINVLLIEDNGIFENPNDSLKTSMHISILFAISKLAKEFSSDDYPMIFDAPTSTFGELKTTNFLNVLNEVGNQKILLIKDFITRDLKNGNLTIKNEFRNIKRDKAFWVKLQRPFDEHNLSTINTEVVEL